MIYLPENKIFIKPDRRFLKKSNAVKTGFYAMDTETYLGKCVLIADSQFRSLYRYSPNFRDDTDYFEAILRFMMQGINRKVYRVFYNIDFDISAILKVSPIKAKDIERLFKGEMIFYKSRSGRVYSMVYYSRRFFKLSVVKDRIMKNKKGKKRKVKNAVEHTVYYTDLFPFFAKRLEKACRKHLGKGKFDAVDSEMLNTDWDYWNNNLRDIIYYCKMDASLTEELGNWLLGKLKETRLKLPRFMTSFASITKQNFRYYCRMPSMKTVFKLSQKYLGENVNILDIAESTYYAHRIELLKRGHFSKAYYYDINSAFPFRIKSLPSLKYGQWREVDTVNPKECIGFYEVFAQIPEDIYISPIPYRFKSSRLCIFPYGKITKWVTWYEADLLNRFGCIKKLVKGYEYHEGSGEYRPFEKIIDAIFSKKAYYKKRNKDILYDIVKKTMNALYGTFAEKHKLYDMEGYMGGKLYHPIYATIIPAHCRWQLINSIREKDFESIIGFHADSILSEKKLNLPISEELGDWSHDKSGECWCINTGRYQIGEDYVKHRGFEKGKGINWVKLLRKEKNLDSEDIKMPYKHCISMKESLLRHHDERLVNIFMDEYRHLNINADRKRNWDRKFVNCRDILKNNIDSKPRLINYYEGFSLARIM